MEPIVVEITLDNQWRLTFTPENQMEDGKFYNVQIIIERFNPPWWEREITGQVKRDGCADWGGGRPVLIHWCGRKDAELFMIAYDKATAILQTAGVE